MSATELSLDISALVSRAQAGESIDIVQAGEDLAARYPGLGMSPEMISRAIGRAAGMVGVRIEGAEEDVFAPDAVIAEATLPGMPATDNDVDRIVNSGTSDFQFNLDSFATALSGEDAILVNAARDEIVDTPDDSGERDPDALAPPPPRGRMAAALRRALFRA